MTDTNHPIPSATVVVLRDTNDGIEVLMLKKNANINFGGTWVFPGGVIDPQDYAAAKSKGNDSLESAAAIAAHRECEEEAGLSLKQNEFTAFSHWLTPKLKTKLYATWFFITDASELEHDITIDDGEIIEARWLTPVQALAAHAIEEIRLNGPAFVSLTELAEFSCAQQAINHYQTNSITQFAPRGTKHEQGIVVLYQHDAQYEAITSDDFELDHHVAIQHRLFMPHQGDWQYIKQLS